jgi:hypothetical protein
MGTKVGSRGQRTINWWVWAKLRPNQRMQATGRKCPGLRPGAASPEDAAERRLVRAPGLMACS